MPYLNPFYAPAIKTFKRQKTISEEFFVIVPTNFL